MKETSRSDIYNLKLGKATATKLVDRFGDLTTLRLSVIENPNCLSDISGISESKASQILEQLELTNNINEDQAKLIEVDESELYFQLLDTLYNIIYDNLVYAAKNVRYPRNANIDFIVCVDNDDAYIRRDVICSRFRSRMRELTHDLETDFVNKALDIASEYNIIYSKQGVRDDKPFRFCFNRWKFLPDSSSNYIRVSITRLESFLNKELSITYAPKPEVIRKIKSNKIETDEVSTDHLENVVSSCNSESLGRHTTTLKNIIDFLWMKKLHEDEYAVAYNYVLLEFDDIEFSTKSRSSHVAKVQIVENKITVIESEHSDILKAALQKLFTGDIDESMVMYNR